MGLHPYNHWNHITTVGTILQPLKPYYKMHVCQCIYPWSHIYEKRTTKDWARPSPVAAPTIPTSGFKYNPKHIYIKVRVVARLVIGVCISVCAVGRSGGRTPQTPYILQTTIITTTQTMSDTWHPWISPRLLIPFSTKGHVSLPDSTTVNQPDVATSSVRSIQSCHIRLYGLYSQHQNFCLFNLMNRKRYLLHTETV
jgi:hypothetical protein